MKKALIACECSGIVRDAFRRRGYYALSCDFQRSQGTGPHFRGDVRELLEKDSEWDIMIAHPPCTYLCVSGSQHWKHHPKQVQLEALSFVLWLYTRPIHRICIENPVGTLSTHWRKPDQYIQPYQFGHSAQKKTGLWLKNLPLLQPTYVLSSYKQSIHSVGSSVHRGKIRSTTFKGIALAMASQWGDLL